MEHSFYQKEEALNSRIGFHYFPDHLHFRMEDLELWIPKIKEVGADWLVIRGETIRAIPEDFIDGLVQEGIEPIIHFPLDLSNPIPYDQLHPILAAYAKWGVKYVIFFEKPNLQSSWGTQHWAQANIVAAFVDLFLPLAQHAIDLGLTPVFPPLEPGGQYWDTVFLQQALEEMQKRNAAEVLNHLAMSAYAWTWGKSLDWGTGGAEQWPQTKPYRIPPNSQDQRSLRTYEWYQVIARKVIGKPLPTILLQAGLTNDPNQSMNCVDKQTSNSEAVINIMRLLKNENVSEESSSFSSLQPIKEEVLCGNFWLLSCNASAPFGDHAWFNEKGEHSKMVDHVLDWNRSANNMNETENEDIPFILKSPGEFFSIARYLYFPSLEYFLENEQRMEIQEYLIRHQPTIGFSLKEAAHAAIVDIGADEDQIPDGFLDALRQSGCSVRRLWNSNIKEVNEDYAEELADYPGEKDFSYAEI